MHSLTLFKIVFKCSVFFSISSSFFFFFLLLLRNIYKATELRQSGVALLSTFQVFVEKKQIFGRVLSESVILFCFQYLMIQDELMFLRMVCEWGPKSHRSGRNTSIPVLLRSQKPRQATLIASVLPKWSVS